MSLMPRFLCIALLVGGALAETPKTPDAARKPPNVIVITLDTTRADRMGFLGSKRGLTPNLDLLAGDAAVFTRAYSQAPLTPTSHSSILTGTYPQYHQVLTFPIPLAKTIPYLPAILKENGYSTAAVVGAIATDYKWGVPGFERGFDTYDANFDIAGYTQQTRYQTVERRGGEVVTHALDWLSKHPHGPVFMWLHLFDPHTPYDPPEPYKTRYAKAPYDGEIAYVDSVMGKFFRQLKASGLYDNTLVVLTADHGESLGAHGEEEHGIFLYDDTIHVPLVIKLPHDAAAGKRIESRVELVDIVPTVLSALGISVPEHVQGQSLLGFLEPDVPDGETAAKAWRDRGAYSQADYGHLTFGWSAEQSLRMGKYLFIQAPRRELYDDAIDPKAEHNLAGTSAAVADTLSGKMAELLESTSNQQKTALVRLDDAKAQQLAVLGYMASRGGTQLQGLGGQGADPKDKIGIANVVTGINNLLGVLPKATRCNQGIPLIRKALRKYPDLALLHFFMGGCYLDREQWDKAIPELQEAVKLDPSFSHAEANLGRALMRTQRFEEATEAFEHVVKSEPNDVDAHTFLIILYSKADRQQDVIRECQAVLHSIPDNYGANVNLGRALLQTGDAQGAIAPLQLASQGEPDKPGPHAFLAEAYDRLGRTEDARREMAEAQRLANAESGGSTGPQGESRSNTPEQN